MMMWIVRLGRVNHRTTTKKAELLYSNVDPAHVLGASDSKPLRPLKIIISVNTDTIIGTNHI